MSDRHPLVTAIVPCFNSEAYVREALGSLLKQTYRPIEIIAINDGSTDSTAEILKEYQQLYGIQVIEQENQGVASASNHGIQASKGEFIVRMDSDDVSLPTRVEKQVRFLTSHPEVVVVGGRLRYMDEAGNDLNRVLKYPLKHDEILKQVLGGRTAVGGPVAMFRRDACIACGMYREGAQVAEDLDLWLRMSKFGRLANLRDILINYRIRSNSLSRADLTKTYSATFETTNEGRLLHGLPPLSPAEMLQLQLSLGLVEAPRISGLKHLDNKEFRLARRLFWSECLKQPFDAGNWYLLLKSCFGISQPLFRYRKPGHDQ